MKRTKQQIYLRMQEVFNHMLAGGKVVVKDKYDGIIKESSITAVYSDHTVTLSNTVNSDYSIFDVTLKPLKA